MAIIKYTATYSDGSSADFLSLEDLIAHDGSPELHPDANLLPQEVAPEVPADAPVEPVEPAGPLADPAPAEAPTE